MKTILVKVKPNAPKTKMLSQSDDLLEIALAAPAVDGKANRELVKFLKKTFKKDIEIIRGKTTKTKLIKFT